MAVPKVRADYGQLTEIALRFGDQKQAIQHTLWMLQRWIDVLQGGDWVGWGATAFYQEMGGEVMPRLNRLADAFESAQIATLRIIQVIEQAEADIAHLFHGAEATPSEIASRATEVVESVGKLDPLLDLLWDANWEALAAGVVAQQFEGASPRVRDAVMRALEEGSVDRQLSMFSSGTRELVKLSPTLRAQILQLEQKGYIFKTGPEGGGSYCNRTSRIIVIEQPQSAARTVSVIAHEAGHGVSTRPHSIPPSPTMTRAQYVQQNVDNFMLHEGEAQYNRYRVRAELQDAGGPDIAIPGTQTADYDYERLYHESMAGRITREEAIKQMGSLMEKEVVSIPPNRTYPDFFADRFGNDWDTNIAPTREPQ